MQILVIRNGENCPPGLALEAISSCGFTADVVAADAGQPVPPTTQGAAAVIVLGGFMGAYETDAIPYLNDVMGLIRAAAESDTPVFGLCLGAQLAARALGGRAYPGSNGRELGWHRIRKNAAAMGDPVLSALDDDTEVIQWHGDTFDLPPGATRLASSEQYENQAFRLGSVVAVQFHPEVDSKILVGWHRKTFADAPHKPLPALESLLDRVEERTAAASRVLYRFCETVGK